MRLAGDLRSPRVAVVGAGVSGLCMAVMLREAGIESFTVFEKSDRVAGTWRENTYPGLYCDIASRYYQYSFAPNPNWSRWFSPGPEIARYLADVVDRFGLRGKIAFGEELTEARWEDGIWRLHTRAGERAEADFVVAGSGFLHHPYVPAISGLDSFAGAWFHSARWDHSVPLDGARVGVIGGGSTGVQIVTAIASRVERLVTFQRTPQWVYPMPNPRYSRLTRAVHRRFPALGGVGYQGWRWLGEALVFRAMVSPGWQRTMVDALCRAHLHTVRDPGLRSKLTPSYDPMCKRLVVSGRYYREVQRPNVEVVTEAIERVVPEGVVTADGRRHDLDVLVLATGFDAHAYVRPMEFVGPDGRTLSDAWRTGPRVYGTVAVPGFPNLFILIGPHSPVNNSSMFNVAESQVGYVMQLIERWRRGEASAFSPTEEATARFNRELRDALPGTVWVSGCRSWYIGADGLPEVWPWPPARHRELMREPMLEDYRDIATDGDVKRS
ncbi:MAG: NAD(P)/FAD-dependent oxidoreductase [Solirubrobacterales bacterium]|nr:NAD(P)/FAD-dependent oxidoreductase [Solirubrobacterales bacterium]